MNAGLYLCLLIFSALPSSAGVDETVAIDECRTVAALAVEEELPLSTALALAYFESKFNAEAVSIAGALGPLQVLPRWHCVEYRDCRRKSGARACRPLKRSCDVREAGLNALAAFLTPLSRQDDARARQTIWREAATSHGFRRANVERALCGFTGCAVDREGRPLKSRLAFVRSIMRLDLWLRDSLACKCSLPKG